MALAQKCIFPMHYMNVSQSYNGAGHKPHWDGADKGKADYPIDICGMDSGKDYFYAPCDCKITKLSVKDSYKFTNMLICVSTKKVQTPKYGQTQIFFKAVHFPYECVKKFNLYEGRVFKKGDVICTEGMDFNSTGNHIHLSQGVGYADKSIYNKAILKKNRKLVANGDNKKPESIFYLDTTFTKKVINAGGITWTKC